MVRPCQRNEAYCAQSPRSRPRGMDLLLDARRAPKYAGEGGLPRLYIDGNGVDAAVLDCRRPATRHGRCGALETTRPAADCPSLAFDLFARAAVPVAASLRLLCAPIRRPRRRAHVATHARATAAHSTLLAAQRAGERIRPLSIAQRASCRSHRPRPHRRILDMAPRRKKSFASTQVRLAGHARL